jgi:peroxiredoxin
MIKVGSKAPDFTLFDSDLQKHSLKDYSGKKVALAFYPGAFTSVCTKEMCTFRDSLSNFNKLNATVLGISVDSPFANKAFAEQNNLNFPLLSDYARNVSKLYGGVHEDFAGLPGYSVSKRAVFVIDEKGVVKYAWVTETPSNEPPYEEIKKALQ